MATFESLTPHIYLLLETRSKHFDSPDDVRTVGLHVNGVGSVFTIFFPTSELSLALLTEHQLIQWAELTEGEVLLACDLDSAQRNIVITLLRAYRASYFRLVSEHEITLLFRLLVEAAMALDDHKPADDILKDLVAYIDEVFPQSALVGADHDGDHALHMPLDSDATGPLSLSPTFDFPSALEVDVKNESDAPEDLGRVDADPTAPTDAIPFPGPDKSQKTSASIPTRSRAAPASIIAGMRVRRRCAIKASATGSQPSVSVLGDGRAQPSPVAVSESDEGWESDDSCPSLKSVADSSDGEEDQDLMSGMRAVFEADIADFLASLRRD